MALVMALSLVAGLCAPEPLLAAKRKHKRAAKRVSGTILLVGSSSINGSLGEQFENGLRRLGYRVWRKGQSSSGFARPDFFDWNLEIAGKAPKKKVAGAIIYLGTNDAQAIRLRPGERKKLRHRGKWLRWDDRRWRRVYEGRVALFARALCARGVSRVLLVTPVDVRDGRLRARVERIRAAQARAARRVPCARALTGRGDLQRILREHQAGGRRIRQPDGTHLTRYGSKKLWRRLARRIDHWLQRGPVVKKKRRRLDSRKLRRLAKKRQRLESRKRWRLAKKRDRRAARAARSAKKQPKKKYLRSRRKHSSARKSATYRRARRVASSSEGDDR